MASKPLIPLLIGFMLLTGVCNTLLTKYQDMQCVENCDAVDPNDRKVFEQPVWQTIQMFVGETGCWLVVALSSLYTRYYQSNTVTNKYAPLPTSDDPVDATAGDLPVDGTTADPSINAEPERKPLDGWKITLLALPATCDIIATTFMNIGLFFVAASIYQMTRGALVLFVGLFSVLFLRRRLVAYKWLALVIVVVGVAIVGLASYIEPDRKKDLKPHQGMEHGIEGGEHGFINELQHLRLLARHVQTAMTEAVKESAKSPEAVRAVAGVCLIALAQIFTASQFVLEEAIMERYALEPLRVVGWEGIFGLLVTSLGLLVLHLAIGRTPNGQGGYFDARAGWSQIVQHRAIAVSSVLIMISIGGFNFFGLSVTRNVSATSRSTIDTCRTLFIWLASLGLRWESFKWLQVLGFAGLVYGTFLFNDIISPPRLFWRKKVSLAPRGPPEDDEVRA